ncbi:PRC-barrel domain-containing protein [Glacieibacterium sp.]|uniref:PRC-barrel domain-containing protein n=1 Tax=Glacieibacterium sp. TaxID=2860237 RepID=UPI003AFFAD02
MSPPDEAEVAGAAQTTLVAAGALLESSVLGSDGKALGKVAEIMMIAGKGDIAYVVLASGGMLGIGETLHAVTWCDFTIDPADGHLSLPMTAAELAARPGFDKDNWPSSASSAS